jgi:hypothetical protein
MLKLRRRDFLLNVAAMGASALALPGCDKGDKGEKEQQAPKRRGERNGDPKPSTLKVYSVSLSPDGSRLLVSYYADHGDGPSEPLRTLSLWDARDGKELWGICDGPPLVRLLWLPDGKHFLIRGSNGRPALWDAGRGRGEFATQRAEWRTRCAVVNPCAPRVCVACGGRVRHFATLSAVRNCPPPAPGPKTTPAPATNRGRKSR